MRRLPALAAAAVLLASVCMAGAMEIETARGSVDIASPPRRIAVYDIPAIDTLNSLGVEIAGVPDNLFMPELADVAAKAETVGTLFEPDLEALSALGPDLIVVGARSSVKYDSVARIAPTIDMTLSGADMIGEARAQTLTYGRLFGREAEAAELVAGLDRGVERAREAMADKGTALIVMTSGPKISVYGPESRFGWLHREFGLAPAAETAVAAHHGEAVSFEFVREANPDWLIVLDRAAAIGAGEANARATLDNELVAATTAWRKQQVVYLPAADFYIGAGGMAATVRVLDALAQAFSAE
jgi:iron complex transport system substrate-binding protein